MSEILAKSLTREKITLSSHTKDVILAFDFLKKTTNFLENEKTLMEAIRIAIYLHDLGKVLPSFQVKTLRNVNYEPYDIYYEVPHSLFSVFWVNKNKLIEKLGEDYFNYVISAIAYHHWRDNFENFIFHKDENFINLCEKILKDWKDKLKSNLLEEFSSFDEYKDFVDINESWIKGVVNGRRLVFYALPPYKFDYEPLRGKIKKDWILISGFLQRCDHFASWCEEEGENLSLIEIKPPQEDEIKRKIEEKIGKDAWQFKKLLDNYERNIILIAPTGYGKTEFSFLWGKGKKFIYTLPIRSAVNQIFEERAKKIFGEDKVGLLHSDADVYLLEKRDFEIDSIKPYELSKQLSFPVIISTGDQFFPYALRPPGYEKIFSLIPYSKFVIDEIQAYDPKACAIITKFMEWIRELGGKFLLMTATLPKFVKDRIKSVVDSEVNIYEEEKNNFSKIFKHKIKIKLIEKDKSNKGGLSSEDAIIDEIIDYAKKGKRVLVILNSISYAQEIYKRVKEKVPTFLSGNVYLLHSKYTISDRKNKENIYTQEFRNPKPLQEEIGKILISTQVVEASLDIDADVLFTEICPMDALVQRMGRVLRRYFYREGKVVDKSSGRIIEIKDEISLNNDEPNVYIWILKDKLHSGGENVYSKELIKLSLFWLFKKALDENVLEVYNKFSEIDFTSQHYDNKIEEIFQKEITSIISKSDRELSYTQIIEDDLWLENLKDKEIILSEYDKYILVDIFYCSLKKDGKYLKEYHNTLSLLDAGFMSEKKSEAQRIFREIYSITLVPKNLKESFLEAIKIFIEEESEETFNYVVFKQKIISKYCVSVDIRKYLKDSGINLKKINEYIYEKPISRNYERVSKVIRWLNDIYYDSNSEYDEEKGFLENKKKES